MAKRHFKFQKMGYTLVEIVVAMTVLLLGLIPMGKFLVESLASSTQMGTYTQAEQATLRLLAEIRTKKWDANEDAVSGYTSTKTPLTNALGESREPAEDVDPTNKNIFNDIDDYRYWIEQGAPPVSGEALLGGGAFGQFTSSVTVQYVIMPDTGGTVTPNYTTPTDYKQIIVYTQWTGPGGKTRFVKLSQVMSNYKKR